MDTIECHEVKPEIVEFTREASMALQAKLYLKLSVKYRIAALNIFFDSKCLKNRAIPAYIRIRASSSSTTANNKAVENLKKISFVDNY
jgi:hypothetical protein